MSEDRREMANEAAKKRRIARQVNALLESPKKDEKQLDGRTEKRRLRLIRELIDGRRGQPLKPLQVVQHVDQLLGLGETTASLKKQGVKIRKIEVTEDAVDAILEAHEAYGFDYKAWIFLGIRMDTLLERR